jgi:exo-1,4-beta-D-glucosaminidase
LGTLGAAVCAAADVEFAAFAADAKPSSAKNRQLLRDGWKMQSSAKLESAAGPPAAAAGDWYSVSVSSTVLAGLVASGEYSNLFYADNLNRVPKNRFTVSWWYQKQFDSPAAGDAAQTWLYFKGINYRANIWLNGKKIAGADRVMGTYRDFEFNITGALAESGSNLLNVEVLPPDKNDLAITFVDWAPKPPDQNMGLWQEVELHTSGPLALRYPHVLTDVDLPSLSKARLTVMVDVTNPTDRAVTGVLRGSIEQIQFTQDVKLGPKETRTVEFSPEKFSQLAIDHPRIWWPWQLGKPEMYPLKLEVSVAGTLSDEIATEFGVRHVTSRLQNGHRLFSVNGVDLLIVGGGYAPDLLQRRVLADRPSWQEDQIRYLRDMNLNTVRLEGKLEDDAFYDICDRLGVLVMPGWCCCSPWEQWKNWKDEQNTVAVESLRYQIRRARNHPSMLAWLNGSDNPPPPAVEKQYLAVEDELKWPAPIVSSATDKKSSTGASGVKMNGPYKWVPPIYWLTDKKTGGAWGFNTEVGPGAVPPPLESLEAMLPKDHRWPIDDMWDFHCGGGEFKKMNDFTQALDARFGKPTGIADFAWKSQAQAYETIRAMYEGFRANKFEATGEIQWMLNNAWPSMIWHLYDYYLRPGAAYFATKIACEPLHVLYRYDNHAIVVVNDVLDSFPDVTVSAEVYDLDGKRKYEHTEHSSSMANSVTTAFTLPALENISTTHFLRLQLTDADPAVRSVNSYWLSTTPDVLDFSKSNWNITPCKSFADYTELTKLPKVKLECESLGVSHDAADDVAKFRVANTSEAIAFMVRLKLNRGAGGEELLPIRWQDNYFMLLPGEKREISARYFPRDAARGAPMVSVDCFNNGRN